MMMVATSMALMLLAWELLDPWLGPSDCLRLRKVCCHSFNSVGVMRRILASDASFLSEDQKSWLGSCRWVRR